VVELDRGNSLGELLELVEGRLYVVGVDEIQEWLGNQRLPVPSEGAFECGVRPLEVPVRAGDAEHVERKIEESLELPQELEAVFELVGHLIERSRQQPDLVFPPDLDASLELTLPDPVGDVRQIVNRPCESEPDEDRHQDCEGGQARCEAGGLLAEPPDVIQLLVFVELHDDSPARLR
jgi:hypothetical protein